ncbi:MAG: hypothetical protein COV67_10905 [Nitrospinae bacterium CG11_big_fil_rev_8_21_14_0_20_56_8]|nr:MAG: hypothetical protein COV67_10905 [Nitrospinae bacterium CG11_big_fil_rev_8_21_14_0_20_56_8]
MTSDLSDNLSPSFQCADAIEVSLCIEKEGMVFYEKAAKHARNPKVRDIFGRLAREEKEHIHSLQEKAKFLQPAVSRKAISRKHVEEFISAELSGKVFPVVKGKVTAVPQFQTDLEALQLGIESEMRSIEVLGRLMESEKKMDVRAIFSHLLAEERKHLAALEELKGHFSPGDSRGG